MIRLIAFILLLVTTTPCPGATPAAADSMTREHSGSGIGGDTSGGGAVVTGKFVHLANNLVDVAFEGDPEIIQTTDTHPFWSVDREIFQPLSEFVPGDRVSACCGIMTIKSITARGPPEPPALVYNLEVHGEHVFHVGKAGVLVHNTGGCPTGSWREVARRSGPSLETQSAFSGKPIKYRDGKAYIEEFELDGVRFDRFRGGVLGEVKDDYDFAFDLSKRGNTRFIDKLVSEARSQVSVARKHNLSLEWHVRKRHLAMFQDTVGRQFEELNIISY